MIEFASFLVLLATGLANGQLNFEGNPLTEFTEYTAEESNLSERTSAGNVTLELPNHAMSSRPQKLYRVSAPGADASQPIETDNFLSDQSQESRSFSARDFRPTGEGTSARQFHVAQPSSPRTDSAEVALNTFLNSKTPEESRASLEHYLRSQSAPEAPPSRSPEAAVNRDTKLERVDSLPVSQLEYRQSMLSRANQQMQQLTPPPSQNQLMPQIHQQMQRQQPPTGQSYIYAGQPPSVQTIVQPAVPASAGVLAPGMMQPVPLVHIRNDMITPAMWRQRLSRIRKPLPLAQARLTPGMYNGHIAVPVPVPFKPQTPVEVIYTKPPGFHRGPPIISGPPGPYEDASMWFPEAGYPPRPKDVYYSQLYAQSFDPHYYNYIAATGKIRPHLYGKLGKRKEEEDEGIWSELYRGFTKHGLKNIMTPTFLLGMTLPVVTLMLSALVQKRGIARADARDLAQEEALQEYLERMQRAMECYSSGRMDDC